MKYEWTNKDVASVTKRCWVSDPCNQNIMAAYSFIIQNSELVMHDDTNLSMILVEVEKDIPFVFEEQCKTCTQREINLYFQHKVSEKSAF